MDVEMHKRIVIEIGECKNTRDDICSISVEDLDREIRISSLSMNLDKMSIEKEDLIHKKVMEMLSHLECLL